MAADKQTEDKSGSAETPRIGRLRSMQHPLDAMLYHPLAARLARALQYTPITPNMVSFAGGLMVVLAAVAYTQIAWPVGVALGIFLHASWHVLDGADGDLARLTGKASEQGEIFDGICDYTSHVVLYLMLAHFASQEIGWIAWVLAVGAGFSRILQANFYESQRRQYLQWLHEVAWLRTTKAEQSPSVSGALGRGYVKLASLLAPGDDRVDTAVGDPVIGPQIKKRLYELGPKAFSGSSLLGANYRTLALGIAMLAQSPASYFLFEIVLLNIVLIEGVVRSRHATSQLRQVIQVASRTSR